MYDREAAISYARRWALSRNPQFYNFEGQGGDCANFVSQCLYAGVGEMNFTPTFGWYYISPSDRTASWSGVRYLYNFLIANEKQRGPGPFAVECEIEQLIPGDVVQLSFTNNVWAHTLFVTKISDVAAVPVKGAILQGAAAREPFAGRVLIATHTIDSLDRPLNSYIYEQARYLHIEG